MLPKRIKRWWLPYAQRATPPQILLTTGASFIGLLAVALISRAVVGTEGALYIAAYMGAATVLVFAAPHSPLTQPWPLIGGHVVSAVIGVACFELIPDPMLASVSAVALAIFAMHLLRCMHPPGGAAAMVAVIGGPKIHALGFSYALIPVGLNALVMLALALVINNAIPGRRYPAAPPDPPT